MPVPLPGNGPETGAATVLVVDDEPNIRELLSAAPRLSGFEVRAAECGASALREALDADVPVLFLTAKDAVEDRIAGLSAGGGDYVTKPFSLDELVLRLKAILAAPGRRATRKETV